MRNKIMRVDFVSSACSTQFSEDSTMEHRSETSASAGIDKTFIISAANTLQALVCLSSLMGVYAEALHRKRPCVATSDRSTSRIARPRRDRDT
jgi:hypothetical protein